MNLKPNLSAKCRKLILINPNKIRMLKHISHLLLLLSIVCFSVDPAGARERILSYEVTLNVSAQNLLTVRERIEVVAEGNEIKRGIFRDIPVRYRGAGGVAVNLPIKIISVQRGGRPEPYFTQKNGNDLRVYFGQESVFLERGIYVYDLVYEVRNAVGFFENHDELYWNAIGTQWIFPIEKAKVTVKLPNGANIAEAVGYFGAKGTNANRFNGVAYGNEAVFELRSALSAGMGLTIVTRLQKGVITPPTEAEKLQSLLRDNVGMAAGFAGLLGVWLYFYRRWQAVGVDPAKGVVVPLFRAPHGLSPVALGFVHERGFKGKIGGTQAMTIALTSLAIKGFIKLKQQKKQDFRIERTAKPIRDLPKGEQALLETLFDKRGKSTVELDGSYQPFVARANEKLLSAVEHEYANDYFKTNRGDWAKGLFLSFACIATMILLSFGFTEEGFLALFLSGFLSIFSVVFYFMARKVLLSLSGPLSFRLMFKLVVAVFVTGMFVLPLGGLVVSLLSTMNAVMIALVMGFVFSCCLFYWLLEAPTVMGRKVMDEIEGYQRFLSVTEWDRMQVLGGPQTLDVETFESHLPYSMALGVDKAWTKAFAAQAALASTQEETDYAPNWYSGQRFDGGSLAGMSSGLSAGLASGLASAATAPSQSSGSFGGGSVGGGGGGGGGGGW